MRVKDISLTVLALLLLFSSYGSCAGTNRAPVAEQSSTITMSRQDFNKLRITLTEAKSTLVQAQKQLDESNKALTEARTQLAESRQQVTVLKEQLTMQKQEIATLKTQLAAASGSLSDAKESLVSTQIDYDKLEKEHQRTERNLRNQRKIWQWATVAALFVGMKF